MSTIKSNGLIDLKDESEELKRFLQDIIHINLNSSFLPCVSLSSTNENKRKTEHSWKVPRRKLTKEFLNLLVKRSPARRVLESHNISHLKNDQNSEIILVDDIQQFCKASSMSSYEIVLKPISTVTDAVGHLANASYVGGSIIYFADFPVFTLDGACKITKDVFADFVISAIIKHDQEVKEIKVGLHELKSDLIKLEKKYEQAKINSPITTNSEDKNECLILQELEEKVLKKKEKVDQIVDKNNKKQKDIRKRIEISVVLDSEKNDDDAESHTTDFVNNWILRFEGDLKKQIEDISMTIPWREGRLIIDGENVVTASFPEDVNANAVESEMSHFIDLNKVQVKRIEDGEGIWKSKNESFEGFFMRGRKHGEGVSSNLLGTYSGGFINDKFSGNGTFQFSSGDVIVGDFAVNKFRQDSLLGENPYIKGEPHGYVEINFAGGGIYIGQMKYGRICGKGRYESSSGEIFSGMFENGYLHGSGRWESADGSIIKEGQWKRGDLHGSGKITWPTYAFRGYFLHGCKDGRGTEVDEGGTYESHGMYLQDVRHSFGMTRFVNNSNEVVYEGDWNCDRIGSGGRKTLKHSGYSTYRQTIDNEHIPLLHSKAERERLLSENTSKLQQSMALVRRKLLFKNSLQ